VNVIGVWQKGFSEPIWNTPALAAGESVTNLKAEDGLAFYFQRMKIEETFQNLKSLLNFHKLMNKRHILDGKDGCPDLDRLCCFPSCGRNHMCPDLHGRLPEEQTKLRFFYSPETQARSFASHSFPGMYSFLPACSTCSN
jgi:hypothetical protein